MNNVVLPAPVPVPIPIPTPQYGLFTIQLVHKYSIVNNIQIPGPMSGQDCFAITHIRMRQMTPRYDVANETDAEFVELTVDPNPSHISITSINVLLLPNTTY